MEKLPTQNEVEKLMDEIIKTRITDEYKFLIENYEVLNKLPPSRRSRTVHILIGNCFARTLQYTPPEMIKDYVTNVAFYLALQELNVNPSNW
jgi:hypothetical protein